MVLLGHKTNYLLVKDDVGKAKPTTRDLPHNVHRYGKAEKFKQDGTDVVMTSWLSHEGGAN